MCDRNSQNESPGRILIIEPLTSAVDLIPAARRHGLDTVVASFDRGERRVPDNVRGEVVIARVDPNDETALLKVAAVMHRDAPFSAVLPGIEFYVGTAARVAHCLGLPGLPVATVDALRNKVMMRDAITAAGLRAPRYAAAGNAAELSAAAEFVGFPAVLKPAASAGAIHVTKVVDHVGLARAYHEMLADDRPDDIGVSLDGQVLLEQYLPGPEISVEGFVYDGHVTLASVTTKILGPEPHFVEVGHILPRDMPDHQRRAVSRYVLAVCRALDVTMGPFHCELRLVDGEPVLVELGARLPGGHIVTLIEWVTGLSLVEVMLAAHTKSPAVGFPQRSLPVARYAGIHNFTARRVARISAITGLDLVRSAEFVRDVQVFIQPGDDVPAYGDFRCRLGYVMFVADTYEQALERRSAMASMVQFA